MPETSPAVPAEPDPSVEAPQTVFDYHRTIIGYHGTIASVANGLVDGKPFGTSTNDDDWLGHGIYFWEYAPQQAWWWADRRFGRDAAVIGAMIRLGRCLDLLDPANVALLKEAHRGLVSDLRSARQTVPRNANTHKYLDCAVFQYLFSRLDDIGYRYDSCRAVFVPMAEGKMSRLWLRSGVFAGGHIQVSVRHVERRRGLASAKGRAVWQRLMHRVLRSRTGRRKRWRRRFARRARAIASRR